MTEEKLTPVEAYQAQRFSIRRAIAITIVFLIATFVYWRYFAETPVDYADVRDHFKYGSIGSDSDGGIPYAVWQILPHMFPEYLPDRDAFEKLPLEQRTTLAGFAQFGFVIEEGKDLPIGFSKRLATFERVGLNCAVCHSSTIKVTEGMYPHRIYEADPYYLNRRKDRVIVLGMPANTLDLEAYFLFLLNCASDPRFTVANVMAYVDRHVHLGRIDKLIYRQAVPRLRETLLARRSQLKFLEEVPPFGPGRVDTFNPYKTIQLNFKEYDGTIGTADFPSLWNQRPREGMNLHWDGNNRSVFERNISAAFGTGATPVSLDFPRMLRVAQWCGSPDPHRESDTPAWEADVQQARTHPAPLANELQVPKFPFDIYGNAAKRGKQIYQEYCASCHDWQGKYIGQVVDLSEIRTDSKRLESFTEDLVTNQSTFGAGHWWRFEHFRKTKGYANMPLDGLWARAPYLHNGSVPSLRDLLNPVCTEEELNQIGFVASGGKSFTAEAVREILEKARAQERRPPVFFRGDDEYDPDRVGFRSDRPVSDTGRKLFVFDTSLPGNAASGHTYGTELTVEQKNELIEYMKTL